MGAETQALGLSSTAYLSPLAGSWAGRGAASTITSTNRRCIAPDGGLVYHARALVPQPILFSAVTLSADHMGLYTPLTGYLVLGVQKSRCKMEMREHGQS